MEKSKINSAVRLACKQVPENAKDRKIEKALILLGVNAEKAKNYGLACFDTRSITGAVTRFFSQ